MLKIFVSCIDPLWHISLEALKQSNLQAYGEDQESSSWTPHKALVKEKLGRGFFVLVGLDQLVNMHKTRSPCP